MATIEDYSDAYYIVLHTDVEEYSGDSVAVDHRFLDYMRHHVRRPIFKLSRGHYDASAEWGIPPNTIAVPSEIYDETSETVLLAKDETALDLIMRNGLNTP